MDTKRRRRNEKGTGSPAAAVGEDLGAIGKAFPGRTNCFPRPCAVARCWMHMMMTASGSCIGFQEHKYRGQQ
jgi:hypothetical protein